MQKTWKSMHQSIDNVYLGEAGFQGSWAFYSSILVNFYSSSIHRFVITNKLVTFFHRNRKQAFANCLRRSDVLDLYVTSWFKALKTYTQVYHTLSGLETPLPHPKKAEMENSVHPPKHLKNLPPWQAPNDFLSRPNSWLAEVPCTLQDQKLPIILGPHHQPIKKKKKKHAIF